METKINEQLMTLPFSPGEMTSTVLARPHEETKKIVLLLHGFLSNKDSETNLELTKRFLAKGIATIRLDLFGHGESDGLFQQLTLSRCLHQIEGMIAWIQQNGYEKIALVGSSFGGLIAIHTASKQPDLSGLALRCPVSNYPVLWQHRLGGDGISHWEKQGMVSFLTEDGKARLEYRFYEDLLKYDTYSDAARIKTPTLIVHGDADDDVPVDQSIRLCDTLRLCGPEKRLVVLSGADHGFSKPEDFSQMADQIEDWILRAL